MFSTFSTNFNCLEVFGCICLECTPDILQDLLPEITISCHFILFCLIASKETNLSKEHAKFVYDYEVSRYLGNRPGELSRNKLIELQTPEELDAKAVLLKVQLEEFDRTGGDPTKLHLEGPQIVMADSGIGSSSTCEGQQRRGPPRTAFASAPAAKPASAAGILQPKARQRGGAGEAPRVVASVALPTRKVGMQSKMPAVIVTGGASSAVGSPPTPASAIGRVPEPTGSVPRTAVPQKASDKILDLTPEQVFKCDIGKIGRTLRWVHYRQGPVTNI